MDTKWIFDNFEGLLIEYPSNKTESYRITNS